LARKRFLIAPCLAAPRSRFKTVVTPSRGAGDTCLPSALLLRRWNRTAPAAVGFSPVARDYPGRAFGDIFRPPRSRPRLRLTASCTLLCEPPSLPDAWGAPDGSPPSRAGSPNAPANAYSWPGPSSPWEAKLTRWAAAAVLRSPGHAGRFGNLPRLPSPQPVFAGDQLVFFGVLGRLSHANRIQWRIAPA
jgi:hypothetical protein